LDNERKDQALEYLNKFVKVIPNNPTLMALKAYVIEKIKFLRKQYLFTFI
jgi:hypothetical protein